MVPELCGHIVNIAKDKGPVPSTSVLGKTGQRALLERDYYYTSPWKSLVKTKVFI